MLRPYFRTGLRISLRRANYPALPARRLCCALILGQSPPAPYSLFKRLTFGDLPCASVTFEGTYPLGASRAGHRWSPCNRRDGGWQCNAPRSSEQRYCWVWLHCYGKAFHAFQRKRLLVSTRRMGSLWLKQRTSARRFGQVMRSTGFVKKFHWVMTSRPC